jgi:hypothetical protein
MPSNNRSSRSPKAVKQNKTIGTLLWFFFVLKVGRLTSPLDELLHYPVPRDDILKSYVSGSGVARTGTTAADSRAYLAIRSRLAENRSLKLHWRRSGIYQKVDPSPWW